MTNVISMIVSGVLTGGVYSLVGMGIVLIYKATGVINFAQGAMLMLAALVGYGLVIILPSPWVAILLTLIIFGFVGYLAERFCLRPLIGQPLLSSVVVTLALSWLIEGIFVMGSGSGGERGYPPLLPTGSLEVGNITLSMSNLVNFAIAIVLFLAFTALFRYSKMGLAMRAVAEDHEVSQSLGISVKSVFSQVWIISMIAAAVSGILIGSATCVSVGLQGLGWKGLIVVIVGGLNSIIGCIVAGPLIGILESFAGVYVDPLVGGGMKETVPFILMLLVMIFRPYGLFGLKRIERV